MLLSMSNRYHPRASRRQNGPYCAFTDDHVMAFTDFGIETLVELIKEHRSLSDSKP